MKPPVPAQRTAEEIKVALAEVRALRARTEKGTADRASLDWTLDRLLEELQAARRV